MAKVRVTLNKMGVRAFLKSDEMQQACIDKAHEVQATLGEGYEVNNHKGRLRANAEIVAKSRKARQEVFTNNSIIKALGIK